jgi:two-component system response regulator FixJ
LGREIETRHMAAVLVEAVTGLGLAFIDEAGRIGSWNAGAEQITGWRAADMLGRDLTQLFAAAGDGETAALLAAGAAGLQRLCRREDGTTFTAEFSVMPVKAEPGAPGGYALVLRDITEELRAEARLRELQSELVQMARSTAPGEVQGDAIVHVVDGDRGVRQSLSFLLASEGFAVRLHESAGQFLDSVAQAPAGCIISDLRMPDIDGIAFLRCLALRGFTLPVIVTAGPGELSLAAEAMKEGAADFIEKPFDDERLLACLRQTLDRHRHQTQREAQGIDIRLQSLSERERQVLDRLVEGKANKVIANELSISPRTVEIYRARVMSKMRAASLPELVRFALRAGAGRP